MEKAVDVVPTPRVVSGHAGPPPGQGPFISLHLTLLGDRVQSAVYETYQCPGCHACGKALCELLKNNTLEAAAEITRAEIIDRVGPLPRHRQICYGLAVLALNEALKKI